MNEVLVWMQSHRVGRCGGTLASGRRMTTTSSLCLLQGLPVSRDQQTQGSSGQTGIEVGVAGRVGLSAAGRV